MILFTANDILWIRRYSNKSFLRLRWETKVRLNKMMQNVLKLKESF